MTAFPPAGHMLTMVTLKLGPGTKCLYPEAELELQPPTPRSNSMAAVRAISNSQSLSTEGRAWKGRPKAEKGRRQPRAGNRRKGLPYWRQPSRLHSVSIKLTQRCCCLTGSYEHQIHSLMLLLWRQTTAGFGTFQP